MAQRDLYESLSDPRRVITDDYPATIMAEVEQNLSDQSPATTPVATFVPAPQVPSFKLQGDIIERPLIGTPYQSSDVHNRKPVTGSITFRVAIAAVIGGLIIALLAHWLLQAPWMGASALLFVATIFATLALAGTFGNRQFMWLWLVTIPGVAYFSYLGLLGLPTIAIPHWTHYGYVPLRIIGVLIMSSLITPLLSLAVIETPINWPLAKIFFTVIGTVTVVAAVKAILAIVGAVIFFTVIAVITGLAIVLLASGKSSVITETTHIVHKVFLVEEWLITTSR